jgi:hypothetical protein
MDARIAMMAMTTSSSISVKGFPRSYREGLIHAGKEDLKPKSPSWHNSLVRKER